MLAHKLQRFVRLSQDDLLELADHLGCRRFFDTRTDIIESGDDPHAVNVVLDGWACRYRLFADGRRQIVGFLLPGDLCDPHVFLLDRMDHSIGAVTPVVLSQISGASIKALTAHSSALARAFHRETLATAAVQREWAVSLGRRSAIERLAHLFCELHARLAAVGLTESASCPIPLTQVDLADALGQTSVHINRTLQELRGTGLISLGGRHLTIHDADGLAQLAHFDPVYLHFTEEAGRP